MIIALTGTPGCGKTRVAKLLAKTRFVHIDLNKLIAKEKLYSGWDKKRKTWIADIDKVEKFIKAEIKKYGRSVVIDSHISHLLPASFVDIVVVLRCDPQELEKRLKRKRWNKNKVQENCEAELIGLILFEARKKHKKVLEIDTTGRTPKQVARKLLKGLINNKNA